MSLYLAGRKKEKEFQSEKLPESSGETELMNI